MLRRLKANWKRFEAREPGERFEAFYREHRDKSLAVKVAFLGIALASFAAGVFFAFIPGPAVLFFALSAGLLASQSLWIARRLDKSEVWGRRALSAVREWRRRRQTRRHKR